MFDKIPPICAMNCHYRFYTLEYFFRSARDNGYKEVEIWTGPMHYYVDCRVRENISKLLDLENQYQIKVIGICPEQTNPKPNNIAALSEEGQIRTLNYFKNEIDAAKLVKANQVVITSGWGYLDQPIQLSWDSSVQMLRKISEYAEQQGIPLAIEALQKKESNLVHTAAELKRLIADVDRPALKVCLDIGAMAAAGDTVQDYFDLFGQDIIHCHFVDVDENGNTHKAWTDGCRSMKNDIGMMLQNGYQGKLSFECVDSKYFTAPSDADRKSMQEYQRTIEGFVQ